VNALSGERIGEIGEALDVAESAEAIAVLSGREGILSAGFDLPTFKRGPEATVAMLRAGAQLIERLLAFPLPMLAVCTGHAYPMGAFLMLSADVIRPGTNPRPSRAIYGTVESRCTHEQTQEKRPHGQGPDHRNEQGNRL
jgi:hypothetical protein